MRQLCYALFVVLILASCRDKVICPAFQSTYILDDSVRGTYFSYAWYLDEGERTTSNTKEPQVLPPDSLGAMVASADEGAGVDYFAYTEEYKVPPRGPKRTKYGIVKRTPIIPNIVRNFQLKTSPMENVLTPPDVTKQEEELLPEPVQTDSSAIAPLDSTATIAATDSLGIAQPSDSLSVAKEPTAEDKKKAWEQFKYGFNPLDSMQPDQEYYFKRYGWLLQNAPPKEEPVDSTQLSSPVDSLNSDGSSERKGLKGLFKKKEDKPKKEKKNKGDDDSSESPVDNSEGTIPEEGSSEEEPNEGGN